MRVVDKLQYKTIKALQLLLVTLGLITPYAYLIGTCYYQAYMNSYGVSIDNFPLSIADTYVNAYVAVGGVIFDGYKWVIFLLKSKWLYIGLIILVFIVYFLIKLIKNSDLNFFQKLKLAITAAVNRWHYKNNDLSKSFFIVGLPTYYVAIIIYFFSVLFVLWWGILIVATNQGRAVNKLRIAEFKKQGCISDKTTHWNNCISVIDGSGEVIYQGLLVAQNSDLIAIFKKDGSYLIKLKDDQIVKKEFN